MKKSHPKNEQEVCRSTLWARANKERVAEKAKIAKGTFDGKTINLLTQSRYRSKKNGLEHSIDLEYIRGLYYGQEGKCALSGIIMTIIGERGSDDYWKSVSLDRINSSKGYVEGNVQLVCTGVNYMKKDMSDSTFISFCKKVSEKFE